MNEALLEDFRRTVDKPAEDVDLAQAALAFARFEYPRLSPEMELRRLDALAAKAAPRVTRADSPRQAVTALAHFLGEQQGFAGNAQHYYDPRNSFLNEVLRRHTGIPITLSVVYLEVGWRLGLPLQGVGFPGHFLIRLEGDLDPLLLDPFNHGVVVSQKELSKRLVETYGSATDVARLSQLLQATDKRAIVARMLRNLKDIYLRAQQFDKALWVSSALLQLDPMQAGEIRDRGLIHQALDDTAAAARDYTRYLELRPAAEDAERIMNTLANLLGTERVLH